jgi:RNA polymerase sigma-70 factor (ECF subfamily)
MKKVKSSDSRALEALYNRYAPVLFTLVKKITGDQETAEEVLTDIFVIIWRKSQLYDDRMNNAYCWLLNLSRNKAIDAVHRKKNQGFAPEAPYDDEFEDYYIIPRLSPEIDELDLRTALSIKGNIEEALHKLTDAQQYVLYLAYYEGLTQNEIALKLKIPVQTVKSKVKIALSNLKENLLKGGE